MRRRKNACRAVRWSAKSRSIKDGLESAAAMVTHEIPSLYVYESPWSEMATKIFGAPQFPCGADRSRHGHRDLGVSISRLEDSLSMNRIIVNVFMRSFICTPRPLP